MLIRFFDQIQAIYQKHDNAALLIVLDSTAKKLRAEHDADPSISLQQRARDVAATRLPDDYWRIFKHMYWQHGEVPVDFQIAADQYRAQLEKQNGIPGINEQDIWLWDEKTAQPMVVLNHKSKKRYRNKWQQFQQLWRVLWILPKLWFNYRNVKKQSFTKTVTLSDRIGIALQTTQLTQELPLLIQLKSIPVLLRFACHEDDVRWQETINLISQLSKQGNKVVVALLQDREAVIHSEKWCRFLQFVLPAIHDKVEWIEVGHAVNRVKWGIWETKEYCQLVNSAFTFQAKYPKLRFIGPAVIDFEWYRIIDVLRALPKKIHFYALSQHLYVDRRGAPENYQGKFSTLEKCALGKAMAQILDCNGRYIISEMNWPLQDTGVWSPIGSPYTAPEWFRNRPGVTEEQYANYLIRYLAITLCSGHVEQVFIWRLAAHGFGLVDDKDNWRLRPAFFALQKFIEILGDATFVERLPSDQNVYLLKFVANGNQIILGWTTQSCYQVDLTFLKNVILTEQPRYFFVE